MSTKPVGFVRADLPEVALLFIFQLKLQEAAMADYFHRRFLYTGRLVGTLFAHLLTHHIAKQAKSAAISKALFSRPRK